jgi:hypothetical protein
MLASAGDFIMNNQNINGSICPNCNQDIGIEAIMKAGLPTLLKCPHCRAKLRYKPVGLGMLLLSVVIYIPIFIFANYIILRFLSPSHSIRFLIIIIMAGLLWLPFEYLIAKQLRRKHNLILKQ